MEEKTLNDFTKYREIFDNYIEGFKSEDSHVKRVIDLKVKHTKKVVDICEKIARANSSSDRKVFLSKLIGLFHDIGRIYQIYYYKTLNDRNSIDHGNFGVELLKKENFLSDLTENEKEIISNSIKYHNKIIYEVPEFDKETDFFVKLIRDADKADIYRVMDENNNYLYSGKDKKENKDEIKKAILNGKQVYMKKSMDKLDHILMSLSWVNEINYKKTFEIIKKQGYLEKTTKELPSEYKDIKEYVLKKLDKVKNSS